MQILLHLVFFCSYGGLAAAIAYYGPEYLALEREAAVGLGALGLLGGGLLHALYARMGQHTRLVRQILALGYDLNAQQEELDWLRRELEVLRAAFDAATQSGRLGPSGRTVEEVMAEAKVLKSLVPRLEAGRDVPVAEARMPRPAGPILAAGHAERRLVGAVDSGGAAAPDDRGDVALDVVREALRDDRVDLVLQPIVSLPQRKRRFYECFSRLRTADGTTILPEQYIGVAERAGLITAVDNMLLFRCVQLIRKIHRKNESVDFFCNISPHSLADSEFFADFVAFLEVNEELAPHLIFEFAQSDFLRWSEVGARLLQRLADRGCRFSLDQVNDLRLDPAVLAARHIRFVKIEAERLLDEVNKSVLLLQSLRRHRIDLIVEKVEDEARLVELLDYEIDFGQGYLFGEPRLARPAA